MRGTSKTILTSLLVIGITAAGPAHAWAAAAKVMLDAGHGGSDPGAMGVNGLYEKDVNLAVVEMLREELVKRGYVVALTRDTDVSLTLAERVELTGQIKPDLFISIHANSYKDSKIQGSMVLYYDKDYPQEDYPASDAMIAWSPSSKKLAQDVQTGMITKADTVDKGLIPSAVYVVRMGSVPSVLVETAFLSNAQDAANLANDSFRRKLAVGIADGISEFIPAKKEEKPPGAFPDIPYDHWANAAIQKLKSMGIVEGEYGRFYPSRALTRAEFIAMLARSFTFPEKSVSTSCSGAVPGTTGGASGSATVTNSTYGNGNTCSDAATIKPTDLPSTHWAYTSLRKALDSGILDGYKDGTIRPDNTLTRGEAAVLIDRIIYPAGSQAATSVLFKDVPKTLWSAGSINRLKIKNIIDGDTADTFAPERPITRAEMSALLGRLIQ